MVSAAELTTAMRETANLWVDVTARETGSRMTAYKDVAGLVGTSAAWLRKFVKGLEEAKEPSLTVGWNILCSYNALCARIEKSAAGERERANALERRINEAMASANGMVARAAETQARGEKRFPMGSEGGRRSSLGSVESREEA